MSPRPLVLLTLVSSLGSCSPKRSSTDGAPPNSLVLDDAGHRLEVRIGTVGDGHPLPRSGRQWQGTPARLVMNAPYQSWSDEGTLVHVVAYTPSLEACARADFYMDYKHIGRADAHGAFAYRRAAGQGSNELLVACQGLDGKWYRGKVTYGAHSRSQEFERPIIYVHADRGVYKPGQRVRVRVLAWKLRGEYSALPNQRVSIFLEGPDGEPVGGGRVQTDDEGVGAIELPLPRNIAEGQYKLVATHIEEEPQRARRYAGFYGYGRREQNREQRAEAPIQIRRFETPVIEVRHTLGEFLTPAMREVPFTVTLGYLDGAPFARARIEVALGTGEGRVALPARAVTGPGPHAFTLSAEQLERFRNNGELRVEIAATDDTGRRDAVVRAMRVVDNPYTATIELDRNGYATGEMVDAALRVTDINSVVQRAKAVRLEGCGQNLNGTTDDTGVAHFRFRMPDATCSVQAFASDARGALANASVTHTVVRPMQSRVLEQRVREREPVTITVNFPADVVPAERVVHGDLTDSSGAIVESFSIPITEQAGAKIARTTIRPPSWGSMLVSLYALGVRRSQQRQPTAIGLLTDGQSLAVGAVPRLEVTLRGVEGELRPGATIPVQIEVKRDGQPADATLGVSLVDRGIINMLDPFEHPPFDRFYDPQQKVLVSTGAQTLTWPVVQRTWGSDRWDIGWLPSFGMHEGAPPEGDPGVWWPSEEDQRERERSAIAQGQPTAVQAPSSTIAPAAQAAAPGSTGTGSAEGFGSLLGSGSGNGIGGGGIGAAGGAGLRARRARAPSMARAAGGAMNAEEPADGLREPEPSAGGEVQNTRGRGFIDDDAPAGPVLIVRTGTDDTSLWLPRVRGGGSQPPMRVRVPETIGEHQFNVLASDRQGGIALARATLTVRQPLYVRADVPETLTVGDVATVTLVARNNSENPVELDLALRSTQWTVAAIDPTHVTAPARGHATARFRVTATQPGRARYEAEARNASVTDLLRADTWVRPAGSPSHERVTESVRAGQPFRATVSASVPGCTSGDCASSYRVARLSVALPESTAWEPAIEYASNAWEEQLESLAARMDAARVYATGARIFAAKEAAEGLAAQSLFGLVARTGRGAGLWAASSQSQASGFSLRGSRPLPVVRPTRPAATSADVRRSARALEALANAHHAGYEVQAAHLNRGYMHLFSALSATTSDADRWLALRAVIAYRAPEYRANRYGGQDSALTQSPFNGVAALRSAHARLEAGVGTDARSYAEALLLWRAFAANQGELTTLRDMVAEQVLRAGPTDSGAAVAYGLRAARALLAWRRQQTAEPGSYDRAHSVLATAVAQLTLHSLDPAAARAEQREVSAYLRSSRARWESWWDAEASSLALQALSLGGTQPERPGAAVIVKVDGREVRHVEIDPNDPWESTLSLRQIELDDAIAQGAGQIEVEYTGALTAQVTLDVERWSARPRTGESLSASAPDSARRGSVVTVRARATRPSDSRGTELWLSLPPYARLEEGVLDEQVSRGVIASWRERDGLLVLTFAADAATIDAAVGVRMPRAGRYSFAALELRDATGRRAGINGPVVNVQ